MTAGAKTATNEVTQMRSARSPLKIAQCAGSDNPALAPVITRVRRI